MTDTTEQPATTESTAHVRDPIWDQYDKDGNWPRKHWKGITSVLVAGGIITGLAVANSGNHQSPRPRAVAHRAIAKPKPQSKIIPVRHPLHEYSFAVTGGKLECDVDPTPYTVKPGDNIYVITETHLTRSERSEALPIFLATIAINQEKGRVGDNPNLIYARQKLDLLENCEITKPVG